MPTVAPYGAWGSPITPARVARAGRRLGAAEIAPDGAVWWLEGRPEEGGRMALMRRPRGGAPELVTPAGFNVRTRVHEYGGGAYAVADGTVFYSNFADQRVYGQRPGGEPAPLTPDGVDRRYADAVVDRYQ